MTVLAELAHAYVALRISTGSMASDTRKALQGIESDAQKTGQSMGSKISSGMGSVLKKSAIGVGVAGGAALAAGLTKGVGRLAAIEQATAKLSGLGNSAKDVEGILTNAMASVKGTAFGLEEAATVAAGVVASGVKPGKELEGVLKTVADTASIAGVSMQDMGAIFGKVAATGKLQGDELNQLSEAGIPALQLLSDHLGKTTEEVRKMVSDGKVSFDDFAAAMEGGMGGAAQKMGDTTVGALKNMGAAAGRLGATLAGPFFTQAGGAFRGVTDLLDGLNAKAGPVMERFGSWLEGTAVPALTAFGVSAADAFKQFAQSEFARVALADLQGVISSLAGSAAEVWPSLVKIGGALADASAALGVSAWSAFVASLQVVSGVLSALTGPLEMVADVMQAQPGLVTAAVAAWMAFKTVPSLVGGVSAATELMGNKVRPLRDAFAGFGDQMRLQTHLAGMQGESLSKTGAAMSVLQTRTGGLSGAMSSLSTALGGPLNIGLMVAGVGLAALAAHSQRAKAQQDALRGSSERLAESQADVAAALQAAGGELSSEVWSELESQVDSTRDSLESVAATGPGVMGALGAAGKAAGSMFGALVTGNRSLREYSISTVQATFDQHQLASQSKDAAGAIADLGLTNEQMATRLYGSGAAYQYLRSSLDDSTEGGRAALDVLSGLRTEFEGQQALLGSIGPEYLNLQDALGVLADSAASADDKLSAMRTTLEILGEVSLTATQQAAEIAQSVDGVGDALSKSTVAADEFDRSFQNVDGSLNGANSNTKPLLDSLTGLQDRLFAVASSGGDVQGAFAQIQPELDAIGQQARDRGLDWDGLRESMLLTPTGIKTMLTVVGRTEVERDLIAIQNEIEGLPDGAETRVNLEGGQEAVDELERLGFKVNDFDGETAFVKVESDEAKQKLNDVIADMTTVENTTAIADIMAANGQAEGAIDHTMGGLLGLDNKASISDILAVNGDAQGKIWQTQGGLDQLGATNPLSMIMAENGQAQPQIGDTQGGLDRLGNTHPKSNISVENSQADSGIRQVHNWLTPLLVPKTVSVVFKAVYQGFRDMLGGGSDNSTGGAWNGTRSLTGFAGGGHSGYRLPTTGLGTGETDGFLAFNSQGIPAARLDAGEWIINGRSSEKYNKELAAINAGVFPKLPGYAEGGRSQRTAAEVLDFVWARNSHGQNGPLDGNPYAWAGINWGDCSAAMGSIARFMLGLAPFAARFATGSADSIGPQWGMSRGKGDEGDFRVAYYNGGAGGGHMWGELPDGTNVEMRGGRGGIIGKDAWGINHPSGQQYLHVPSVEYQLSSVEGMDGLMPPGASTTWAGMAGDAGAVGGTTSPGLYKSPGNSGQVGADQPRTWSDMAAGAVSALVGGQVEDSLGVFGVPNQLPPIVQAWQMLNEKPGGGPSDWDLSTAAAEVKRLDAAIKIREQVTGEAAKALEAMNGSIIGNADQSVVRVAEAELDKQFLDLEQDRLNYERAQSKLKGLLGSRAAAIAEKDLTGASGAGDLASALAPDTSFPDELMRELKVAYDPAGGAEQWRPMVIEALKRNGFAATQREQDLMIAQIKSESGGNPNILQQVQDVNSGGNEAKGLLQVIPGTFAAHRDPALPDDRTDPWANMNAALRYYKSRYGTDLSAMWGKGHGYNAGGWISGVGTKDTIPLVGAPGEFIVNRKAAAENRGELEAMNSGRPAGGSSRGSVTYNLYAVKVDEWMQDLARKEAQYAATHLGGRA